MKPDHHLLRCKVARVAAGVMLIVLTQLSCSFSAVSEPEETGLPVSEKADKVEEPRDDNDAVESAMGQVMQLPCPEMGASLYLGFEHAVMLNYGEVSLTLFVRQGWVELVVTDANGTITMVESTQLKVSMEGKLGADCVIFGEGVMEPVVSGLCQAGVARLLINENWPAVQGKITCASNGDIIETPFDAPAVGVQQYYGMDGNGEVFSLVEGQQGFSVLRADAVRGTPTYGNGYLTWTLYTVATPGLPVPTPLP